LASRAEPVKETIIEPAVEVSKNRVTILKGYFKDAETLSPLEVSIELMDNQSGEMVAQLNSNSKTGKYLVSLPSGKNYGMAAKAEGYLFHSENFNIPEEAAYKEVNKDILMKKIKVGSIIVLNNIFFDYGKYSLRAESTFELGRVFKIMTDNPTIKVEISGHTDSHGSDDFNQKLSENRSKSVVDYLIEKGISKDRLSYKGYGKTQPIATNDTEEGRQQNRRTEFKILEK
jgi:outer membrane protein OmpA-like peptidoglycan-associated protein